MCTRMLKDLMKSNNANIGRILKACENFYIVNVNSYYKETFSKKIKGLYETLWTLIWLSSCFIFVCGLSACMGYLMPKSQVF